MAGGKLRSGYAPGTRPLLGFPLPGSPITIGYLSRLLQLRKPLTLRSPRPMRSFAFAFVFLVATLAAAQPLSRAAEDGMPELDRFTPDQADPTLDP